MCRLVSVIIRVLSEDFEMTRLWPEGVMIWDLEKLFAQINCLRGENRRWKLNLTLSSRVFLDKKCFAGKLPNTFSIRFNWNKKSVLALSRLLGTQHQSLCTELIKCLWHWINLGWRALEREATDVILSGTHTHIYIKWKFRFHFPRELHERKGGVSLCRLFPVAIQFSVTFQFWATFNVLSKAAWVYLFEGISLWLAVAGEKVNMCRAQAVLTRHAGQSCVGSIIMWDCSLRIQHR